MSYAKVFGQLVFDNIVKQNFKTENVTLFLNVLKKSISKFIILFFNPKVSNKCYFLGLLYLYRLLCGV